MLDASGNTLVNSTNSLGVTKIPLGCYVQDDVGAQWHVIQSTVYWKEPTVTWLVLKEHCLKDHRVAIVKNDGTEFVCKNSQATCILSILKPKVT